MLIGVVGAITLGAAAPAMAAPAPVTRDQCNQGGGNVEDGSLFEAVFPSCEGGTHDGAPVQG